MRHHACAAVIGFLTAALIAPVSQSHAASADPTGYWKKPDAERESKIHIFKCGKSKTHLCAKITWIKDPNDSKGRPLHDVRNQNPSLRDRPIMGLSIFNQLAPSAPSTWTGKIYNPEDGQTYSVTLTVVSRKQILLKGCKAWLLCGERTWFRTDPPEVVAPAPPAEETQQIEASVTPQMPEAAPPSAAAAVAAEPASAPSADATVAKASIDAAAAQEEMQAMTAPQGVAEPTLTEAATEAPAAAPARLTPITQEIASPAEPPAEVDAGRGYGFLAVTPDPDATAPQSGNDVSSMMLMAKPIASEAAAASTVEPAAKKAGAAPPEPAAKPKAQPKPVATAAAKPVATAAKPAGTAAKPVATAAAKPSPKAEPAAKPTEQATPAPQDGDALDPDAASADTVPAETAEATLAEPVPLSRRERRQLRRQQREMGMEEPLLPWWR